MINLVELNGEMISMTEYCKRLNYSYNSITNRMYKKGLTFEQAVNEYEAYINKRKVKDNRLYSRWYNMKNRCYNSKHPLYYRYGGRGIKVCEKWHDYFNFEDDMYESFIKHVEKYGIKDTTLDREDFDGDYELSNCTWKTRKEQANNMSTNITIDGNSLKHLCEQNNLDYHRTQARIKKLGWTIEEAINTPVRGKCSRPCKILSPTGETLEELSCKYNIPIKVLYQRYYRGWDWDRILLTSVRENVKYFLPCGNQLKQYCIQFNYNYAKVLKHIKKYNLEPHEALARYLKNRKKKNK